MRRDKSSERDNPIEYFKSFKKKPDEFRVINKDKLRHKTTGSTSGSSSGSSSSSRKRRDKGEDVEDIKANLKNLQNYISSLEKKLNRRNK